MIKRVKVAVVGVGNDVSALVQGIAAHRATGSLAGIRRPVLDGLGVGDSVARDPPSLILL